MMELMNGAIHIIRGVKNNLSMKKTFSIVFLVSLFISFLSDDEISLGGQFILYKGDQKKFSSVGLKVTEHGIQGLFDGDIQSYGYDIKCIVIKVKDGSFYLIDKEIAQKSAYPSESVLGPFSWAEISTKKGALPLKEIP